MLARIKGMSRGGWIAVGLLAGAIAAPGIALAAFSDVRLVSIDGATVAQVTANHQLRAVESDPKLNRMVFVVPGAGAQCTPTQPVPGTAAFVLKEAQFNVYVVGATGQGNNVSLYEGPGCAGNPIARINPAAVGSSVVPFDPGIAMKPGQVFSARSIGSISAEIFLHGYVVTASGVTENTPVIGAPGIPARRAKQQVAVRKRR
jgi:hypothetical protein